MDNYYSELYQVSPTCNSFVDILQNHAVCMHELVKAEGKNCKRSLMKSWTRACRLNDEWIAMICVGENGNRDFESLTEQLITTYTDGLCDYVLDHKTNVEWKKLARFFRTIGSCECSTEWFGYTLSVVQMVDAMINYGCDNPIFYGYSAACIRSVKVLGACLDTLRKRETIKMFPK